MRSPSVGVGHPRGSPTPSDLVDHVGAIVPDVVEARAALIRAGFRPTPIVPLLRPAADGSMVPSGGQQSCLMLSSGYIEFQAIGSAAPPDHPLSTRAARRWGIHVLAFSSGDAAGTADRWQASGLSTGTVSRWSRPAPVGDDALEFSFVLNDIASLSEALVIATQHHTAELLRPADYLSHPNGAQALVEVLLTSDQPDDAARTLGLLADVAPEPDGRAQRVTRGATSVCFGDMDWLRSRMPGDPGGAAGACAVILTTQDRSAFHTHMLNAGAQSLGTEDDIDWFALPEAQITIGASTGDADVPARGH